MDNIQRLQEELQRSQAKLLCAEAEIEGLKETIRRMRKMFLTPAGTPKQLFAPTPAPATQCPARVRKTPLPEGSGILLMLSNFGWKCFYCSCELDAYTVTVDHLLPKSKGGCGPRNQVPACTACNNEKGDRLPTQEEVERAEAVHQRPMKAARYAINPMAQVFPLESIKLGSNGRVICRSNASGFS